ncbi:M43 family zinc metalloprotease [Flavobacterium columnare]|uniref:M43 family zinc metalloprotease n=1 Tax=Flavobacterium columnare TaxID=996 RepID=UPI0013D55121|nr:M43 family zinc metalloprotease [Flavobacterium columnare]
MKKTLILISLLLNIGGSLYAQILECGTKEQNEITQRQNPDALKKRNEFEIFTKKFVHDLRKNKNVKNNALATNYIIPVVFHIYGTTQSGKSVTYDKIVNALNAVNNDFNGLNDDFNSVEPFFQPRRATLNIQFRLAKIDPNGGNTTGVVFHTTKNGYGNGGGYDDQIAADAWDNKKYVNVYIQNDLYNQNIYNNSGVAWYPDINMTNRNTARIVFNGAYLLGNTDKEFSSTLTHEFGHFFNLIHTFEDGCTGTDQVDDTPKEDAKHALSCTPGTNCDGDKVNIENYMGYNGARGCYKMFTRGQVDRMIAAMQHEARITLWQNSNLLATGVYDNQLASIIAPLSLYKENINNNGTFSQINELSLTAGKTFSLSSGKLIQGTHYTLTNFPQGLNPIITINSNSKATLTLEGSAQNHQTNHNILASIQFLPAAFSGGTNNLISDKLNIKFEFIDPYGIFLAKGQPNWMATPSQTWLFFNTEKGDDTSYGFWLFETDKYKLETYGKRLICNPNTRNISRLTKGTEINGSSNFTAPGAYPNQLDIINPSYNDWKGQIGYIGYEYKIDGNTCYGYFKVEPVSGSEGYRITEYAYNTQPGAPIKAGEKDLQSLTSPSNLTSAINNNTIVLNWIDKNTTEDGFYLEKSTNGGAYQLIASLPPNTYTYSDKLINVGITYKYRISAYKGTEKSSYSNETIITAPSDYVDYCKVSARNTYEYIKSIKLSSFTNTSGADYEGYGNYVSKTISLKSGEQVTTVLTPGFNPSASDEAWTIWIDYNDNKQFENSEIVLKTSLTNKEYTGTFSIPLTAKGTFRMRIIMRYNDISNIPCGYINDGEIEDYTVQIQEQNTTLETPYAYLNGGISKNGFYALWNKVPNASKYEVQLNTSGTWYTVGTSTSYYLYVAKPGSSTQFQFRVKALNSTGESNWSTPVNVTLPLSGPINTKESKFIIAPNPATDQVTFSIPESISNDSRIEIYNNLGQLVRITQQMENYSIQNLPRGTYQVKLISKEKVEDSKHLFLK